MVSRARAVEGFTSHGINPVVCGRRDVGSVLLICGPLALAVFLAPLLTFLCLFTTVGNSLHRALRGRPLRTVYRFDLRAMMVLVTFTAISFAWLKALEQVSGPFSYEYAYLVEFSPPPPAEQFLSNWLLIAIPISIFIAAARFAIEVYDDSRSPQVERSPPSWNIALPADSQDSPAPGE